MWKYELTKRYERMIRVIVWHLPHDIIKWSLVRGVLNATNGEYSNQVVPDLKAMDMLERWGE
jgi:hypothetical protein